MVKNSKVEIKSDKGDVVVTDGKVEFYRANKTKQTKAIAVDIYFYHKYQEDNKNANDRF